MTNAANITSIPSPVGCLEMRTARKWDSSVASGYKKRLCDQKSVGWIEGDPPKIRDIWVMAKLWAIPIRAILYQICFHLGWRSFIKATTDHLWQWVPILKIGSLLSRFHGQSLAVLLGFEISRISGCLEPLLRWSLEASWLFSHLILWNHDGDPKRGRETGTLVGLCWYFGILTPQIHLILRLIIAS